MMKIQNDRTENLLTVRNTTETKHLRPICMGVYNGEGIKRRAIVNTCTCEIKQ